MSIPMPFRAAACISQAADTASATVAIPVGGGGGRSVRLTNGSGVTGPTIYVKLGGASVTATTNDLSIPQSTCVVLDRDPINETHVACIAGAAGTLNICVGENGI